MGLTGYRPACGKRIGGIKSVALIGAAAVAGAEYDERTGVCTNLSLAEGEGFVHYHFREDQALYTESMAAGGPVLVVHTLVMSLGRMDEKTAGAVREMCGNDAEGVVAIITTNNGVALLAGWSPKFGTGYPLRLAKSQGATGRRPEDASAETVTLISRDTSKALVFTGSIG